MIPFVRADWSASERPLRTRGDDPMASWSLPEAPGTAPHTRRCSQEGSEYAEYTEDRSAHAEMIRDQPARAEQVQLHGCGSRFDKDQPRACGAGDHHDIHEAIERGSTPRVRSRFEPVRLQHSFAGINPARAEQVRPMNPGAESCEDQPRACGAGSCIVLRSCPGQRHAIFDSFIAESVASAHRYQCDQGRPANAVLQPTRILAAA